MSTNVNRRAVLAGLALVPLLPVRAKAAAMEGALAEGLRALSIKPEAVSWSPGVVLSAPVAADDPTAVPVILKVAEPGAIKAVHLFAPGNRRALVASFTPVSELARPEWQIRIRLAKTQTIAAVAQLADGRVLGAMSEVRVTANGGCRP